MLAQQIEIQSSITNQSPSQEQMSLVQNHFCFDNSPISSFTDNCSRSREQSDQKSSIISNSFTAKMKLKKLQELYNQGLEKFAQINMENLQQEEKQKIQTKNCLQEQLKQFSVRQQNKDRKGSQTSTAGQDEQSRNRFQDRSQRKDLSNWADKISVLEQNLLEVKKRNFEANKQEQLKIEQLTKELSQVSEKAAEKSQNQSIQGQTKAQNHQLQSSLLYSLRQKLACLQAHHTLLTFSHQSLTHRINQTKRSIIHLSNSTEYLKSTQSCCQQILNEQLCSLQYKIQGKRVQYDSNKRYLDKFVRKSKYEENVSFEEIKQEIDYLNSYCEEMINKKNTYYGPQIKKYKHKRQAITEQIKTINKNFSQLEMEKISIQKKTIEQNKVYDQLQDQYCALLEKVDEKNCGKNGELSFQQKLTLLKQKKQQLKQGLAQILIQYEQIKSHLQDNPSLVPQNIIKDLRKKIQKRKQQIRDVQILGKENDGLQTENNLLMEEKQRLQWKVNPAIQELSKEEKELIQTKDRLKESLKALKEENDLIEDKMKQAQKQKKSNLLTQSNDKMLEKNIEGQKTSKENSEKQKNLYREEQEEKTKLNDQQKAPEKVNQTNKGKKGRNSSTRMQSDKDEHKQNPSESHKGRVFFVRRENPLEKLQCDFPLNRSQETSQNISLLQSNPALYMLLIFVTVVIPGLCIGYNL